MNIVNMDIINPIKKMSRIFIMIFTLFFLFTLIYGQQQEGMNARKNDLNNGMGFIKKEKHHHHHHHHHDICAQFVSGSDQQIECLERIGVEKATRVPIVGEINPKLEIGIIEITQNCPSAQLTGDGRKQISLFVCNEGDGDTIGVIQLEQLFLREDNSKLTNIDYQNLDVEGIQWNCDTACSTVSILKRGQCTSRLLITYSYYVTAEDSSFHQIVRAVDSINEEHSKIVTIDSNCSKIQKGSSLKLISTLGYTCPNNCGIVFTISLSTCLCNNSTQDFSGLISRKISYASNSQGIPASGINMNFIVLNSGDCDSSFFTQTISATSSSGFYLVVCVNATITAFPSNIFLASIPETILNITCPNL